MPKQTQNYKLGYYVAGERTDGSTESKRWITVDSQLRGLYEVLGNGVLTGWSVSQNSSSPFAIDVSLGKGVIGLVSAETTDSVSVYGILPSQTYYVSAALTVSTYWDRTPTFSVGLSPTIPNDRILLAKVITSSTGITSIDNTVRNDIGLISSIKDAIKSHRHTGGDENPDLIDLSNDVQGQMSQGNLPDLDASKITTGTLASAIIPKISHITGLTDQGSLSHAQIDSFIQGLLNAGKTLMGETSLVNLLQLILALKHQWPEIDKYLVNEIAIIPGVSSDSQIDLDNTTAEVDLRTYSEGGEHKIYGSSGPAFSVTTKTWETPEEFSAAEKTDVVAVSDLIRIETTETTVSLDEFEEIGDWKVTITDQSSNAGLIELDGTDKVGGIYSAIVAANIDNSHNLVFEMQKTFAPQDWSQYSRISFYIKTDTLEHGDIFFYLADSTYGRQNSYTLILERNSPTINRDTGMFGWREVFVDLTPFRRSAITNVGLFMSTQTGWDASKPFQIHVDKMLLTTGYSFLDDGYARFVYGNGFPQDFWRIRWDALLPSGTVIKARTRVSNNLSAFDDSSPTPAPWSSYSSTSGFEIAKPVGTLYGYIQIEVFFESSPDRAYSSELLRLYLDSRISAAQSQFLYDTQDEWQSGRGYDLDTTTVPGSIRIAATEEVDNVFYGTEGNAIQSDGELSTILSLAGKSLPVSTPQAVADLAPGFGQTSSVRKGSSGTIWVADTDNDRVVQLDKAGSLIFGLYGSFLSGPSDPYGIEETGPGSNKPEESTTTDQNQSSSSSQDDVPRILHSFYNPNNRTLSAVFSQPLEKIHEASTTFDRNKLYLKASAHRIYFSSTTSFSLYGIDPTRYNAWVYSPNQYINQFTFASHVLQAVLTQADAAVLDSLADLQKPSLVVASPCERKLVFSSTEQLIFSTPSFFIGGESSDNNGIRIRVDYGSYTYLRTRQISLTSLSDGLHIVEAVLVDGNNNPLANTEASATVSFVVQSSGSYHDPFISILSPLQGQTFSSSTVNISFQSLNHPILPSGSYLKYRLDQTAWIAHKSENPIQINGLSAGSHQVDLMLVNEYGIEVVSDYSRATIVFNAGTSSSSDLKLYVSEGAIRGQDRSTASRCSEGVVSVGVGNIYMANMYAPVDAEVIPSETSIVNPSGGTTVLISKLRCPTTTYGLNPVGNTADDATIFGTNYLDGHSVIQYDMSGNVIFTNNAAKFADTKTNAKIYLGSASKLDSSDILVADSIRKRAIIVHTDLTTKNPFIIWEYISDRLVPDAQIVLQEEISISVSDAAVSPSEIWVKSGSTVVWKNTSSIPVSIYSGQTDFASFQADPDITLYGDEFHSQTLQPGEQYAFKFEDVGDMAWFSYPAILTGMVHVTAGGMSASDQYLILEKDPIASVYGSRLIKVDSWGNVIWSFGEGILYDPKDVRPLESRSVIISV